MAREELDALLLVNSLNLVYLAGYQSSVLTLARPFFLVVPRRGEPVLLVQRGRRPEALRRAWIGEVRTYEALSVAPVPELLGIVSDLGLRRARIGAELGFEQRMGLSVTEWERIVAALAPAEIVDAAHLLWELRAVKDPAEIAALRRAGAITAGAYEALFASLLPGDRDVEVCRRMRMLQLELGADTAWSMVAGGHGYYDLSGGTGVGAAYEPGDIAWLDAGCSVEGYWSDFSRAAVIGPPSSAQRDAQDAIVALTEDAVARVRPGVAVAELAALCDDGLSGLGLAVTVPIARWAGRVGHGIGLEMTEPPHVSATDRTVLGEGMVISLEPGVATEDGVFHAEANVLVTRDGREVLSIAPSGLTEVRLG
jgi:Xaa-Pro aminopeptidase